MTDPKDVAAEQLRQLNDSPEPHTENLPTAASEYDINDLEEIPEELDVAPPSEPLSKNQIAQAYADLDEVGLPYDELTPREAVEKARELSAKMEHFSQVLSRGQTNDTIMRLLERVPDHLHAEFVLEHENVIPHYEAMNFRLFEDPTAAEEGLHRAGDNRVRVGDTVLMVIPKEDYAILNLVRKREKARRYQTPERKKAENLIKGLGVPTTTSL